MLSKNLQQGFDKALTKYVKLDEAQERSKMMKNKYEEKKEYVV